MSDIQAGRESFHGARSETYAEIAAICTSVFGLLVLLSLLSQGESGNLIGDLGVFFSAVLTFIFGRIMAYVVPIAILGLAYIVWQRRHIESFHLRLLGAFLFVLSACSLAAMPYAADDFSRTDGFRAGGALGNFLVHRDALNLRAVLGATGGYLLFCSLMLVAIIIMTDRLIVSAAQAALANLPRGGVRDWWERRQLRRAQRVARKQMQRAAKDISSAHDFDEPEFPQPVRIPARLFEIGATRRFVASPDDNSQAPDDANYTLGTDVLPPPETSAGDPAPRARGMRPTISAKAPSLRARAAHAAPAADEISGDNADDSQEEGNGSELALEDDLLSAATPAKNKVQDDLPMFKEYELPSNALLNKPTRSENRMTRDDVLEISEALERTLQQFNITAQVTQVTQGPTVTRFEIQPAPGIKVARITGLENDIAMGMRAESVRIIAPIPGKSTVGIEIPNKVRTPVVMREIVETEVFEEHKSPLAFALGVTISGEPYVCDLATMPHLLIAGTTGSGKSVSLNGIVCSILMRIPPNRVRFIMIDPKRVELNVYRDIPHLLAPVVCDAKKAAAALTWAVGHMEERLDRLAEFGVRNIDGYNAIVQSNRPHPRANGRNLEYMPHIVIIIDELADLMMIAKNEVEDSIARLAQMSRAAGMHLILATQRPSVNVITGIIKANFPVRIAFQVSSKVDSRTILDGNGAEALLGRGDMLFSTGGNGKPIRLQGCFLSDKEVEEIASHCRSQQQAQYLKTDFASNREIIVNGSGDDDELAMDGVDADDDNVHRAADDSDYRLPPPGLLRAKSPTPVRRAASASEDADSVDDELYDKAVRVTLKHKRAAVSLLQRKLNVGFARAGRLMDIMEERGIVGPNVGSKVREILVDPEEFLQNMQEDSEDHY